MELSAFSVVDAYPEDGVRAENRAGEVVRLAEAAEAAGLSALWVAEHHFHPGGVCPSPPVLLAACGARTRTLRLGALVCVLPFHRPIDVAEEYSLLDRLLEGRLNFGAGSGYIPLEFEGFGIDPAGKREMFDHGLEVVLAAFAGKEIPSGGSGGPVRLNVAPVQRPHPPLSIAVQRREAIPHVARKGASIALIPYATVRDLDELADEIREYRTHLPPGARGRVSVAVHVYAGERPDQARRALRRYLDSRLQTQSKFYAEKVRDHPAAATPEAIEETGFAAIGGADEVARKLSRFEEIGVDELLGIFDFGGLEPTDVGRSVSALGAAMAQRRRPGSEK